MGADAFDTTQTADEAWSVETNNCSVLPQQVQDQTSPRPPSLAGSVAMDTLGTI